MSMDLVFGYEYTPAAHLLVTDEDAADFLQSQFSNDLRPFEPGRCTYGLWLDVKGKVVADGHVLCEGVDRFHILSEGSSGAVIAGQLARHIIADDVRIEVLPPVPAFSLIGEGAAAELEALGVEVPGEQAFVRSGGALVYRGRRSPHPAFELVFETEDAATRFRKELALCFVEMVFKKRIQEERMAAGIPLVPEEIGPRDMPGEGGLEQDAVSFNKGCFLGQEVVARMHHVGRPQRGLYFLRGIGELPECPLPLYHRNTGESKNVGELRSVLPGAEGWQGVALLKVRHVSVGDVLDYAGGSASVERCFNDTVEAGK